MKQTDAVLAISLFAFIIGMVFKLAIIGEQLDRIEKALSEQTIVRAKP
jgi:hypothetical protein